MTLVNRMLVAVCMLVLVSVVAFAQADSASQSGDAMKTEKKAAKKKEMAPRTDAEIQKCITDKLAASEKLNPQGFSAAVSGGLATLSGNAANAGSKGGATTLAKSCGATSVTNNITVPPGGGMKKKEKKETKEMKN